MLDCQCILDKQIKARPTRCNKWWFIGNQLFLNVFRASLRPSSGEQTACHCLSFHVLAMVVVVPESRVARCVHCAEDFAWKHPLHRTWNHRQWHAFCSPDDGRKDARNMLRNNWLPINHHLLHVVGLAIIYLSCVFLQWMYHPTYAHCDTSFMTYISSFMFRHLNM
jgi:hypothetical protein